MYGKEYEKAKEALEGKRDDVYPCREDVPADLWGKPIPVPNISAFKTPAQEMLDTGQIKEDPSKETWWANDAHTLDYKFNEADILDQIQHYIDSTYDGHYNRDKFQATEFILDGGHGTGFCIGNILKYAQRYGKKGTADDARKDLLKVIHYAIIALYNHDEENDAR